MYFFTADTHFSHAPNSKGLGGIIHHAKRPFKNINEHDDFIINRWNNTVGKKDTTYIIGDFAWKNHSRYLHALNGKKILFIGSHDKMSQDVLRCFTEVHKFGRNICVEKQMVVCCHWAMLTWQGKMYGSFMLHGHSHGRIKEYDNIRRMDVGMDVWNFYPVSFEIIKSIMNKRDVKLISDPDELRSNVDILAARNLLILKEAGYT